MKINERWNDSGSLACKSYCGAEILKKCLIGKTWITDLIFDNPILFKFHDNFSARRFDFIFVKVVERNAI